MTTLIDLIAISIAVVIDYSNRLRNRGRYKSSLRGLATQSLSAVGLNLIRFSRTGH